MTTMTAVDRELLIGIIEQAAHWIRADDPDPLVQFRALHAVVRDSGDELQSVRDDLEYSHWVRLLRAANGQSVMRPVCRCAYLSGLGPLADRSLFLE